MAIIVKYERKIIYVYLQIRLQNSFEIINLFFSFYLEKKFQKYIYDNLIISIFKYIL